MTAREAIGDILVAVLVGIAAAVVAAFVTKWVV